MKTPDEEQQARFTADFYYSCLYNSLVLFAATPEYLDSLAGPLFNVEFERESEFMYAFDEPIFGGNFNSGKVAEELRGELLAFKSEVEAVPGSLWNWEEIISNTEWEKIRLLAEQLLVKLGEGRRQYDFRFTNAIPG